MDLLDMSNKSFGHLRSRKASLTRPALVEAEPAKWTRLPWSSILLTQNNRSEGHHVKDRVCVVGVGDEETHVSRHTGDVMKEPISMPEKQRGDSQ